MALVLLPDRRRTFDRNRLPTPVQHLVAEYEADVTTVSDDHVEDFLRGVGEWRDDWSADARAEAIERHRQRSIHVHCWSQDEFPDTLLHVIETGRQPWDLLDAVFVEDVVDSIEFGYVLRKLPADRDVTLVGSRFREVLDRLRAGHRAALRAWRALDRRARQPTTHGVVTGSSEAVPRAPAGQPSPSRTGDAGAAIAVDFTRRGLTERTQTLRAPSPSPGVSAAQAFRPNREHRYPS